MPLRLLVITSRPLADAAGNPITLLDVEEERRRVRVALEPFVGQIYKFVLPHATTGAVKTALRDAWDIVHFTGHGTADAKLLLENDFGEAHALTPAETLQLFGERKPPLVVLSACHSEIIARALHAAGIPALVAIDARVPIADRAATIFAEHFYGALARGWTIGEAFRDAQQAVALDAQVGDAHPPLDAEGKPEMPWSQRFTLIGDGTIAFEVGAQIVAPTAIAPTPEPRVIGNLRERNANFVGRAKEIVAIVKTFDAMKQSRVAIHGTGGIGKTELAKAVAWWYIERGKVDAVLWASASRNEIEFVLHDLSSLLGIAARALRLAVTEQSSYDEQKRAVREFCARQRTLVLLDNWETLESRARQEVWDFVLSLPNETRVIVTSRDTLPPKDARNYELDTLTPPDGAQLFLNIARNAGYFDRNPRLSNEEWAILSAIVERLGGYPLAIEVVAGQTESRTLGDIWNDLVKIPKNVLEGKDELTGEPRGVWTSLGFSYTVLPAPAQTLFCRMSVFLAPATAEDVGAVVGEDGGRKTEDEGRKTEDGGRRTEDEGRMLDVLVRRSLVRMREGAYALLPIVREYALSQLEESGGDARELHTRAVNHYRQKGTLEGALIASEHLFELAARYDARDAAEAFVEYVNGFYNALVTRGYWAEARRKDEQRIVVARTLGDRVTEAWAIGDLGTLYQRMGEYARAAELYKQALEILAARGDRRGVAMLLHQLGNVGYWQGNYAEARRRYGESLKIAEELRDKQSIARTLHALGILTQDQGDYAEARRLYGECLEMFKELGDKQSIAQTLGPLGQLVQNQGNYDEARQLYDESLKIAEELGDKQGIAQTLGQLGILAHRQGDYAEARRRYGECLEMFKELEDKRGIANMLHVLGILAQQQGDYAEARRQYGESLKIVEELGHKQGIAITLHQLGMLAQRQGDYAEARRLYGESLKIEEELGRKEGIASTLGQLGILAQRQGDYAEARRLYGESLKLKEELGDKQGIATTLHALGVLAQDQGDYTEARRLYGESLKIKEELGDKQGIATTLHQLGMLAQDQGDYTEARRLYGESLKLKEELGDKQGIATTLHQLGMLAQDQGEHREARRLYGESLKIKEELGDKQGIATTLHQLGMLAQDQGDYTEARRLYGESLKLKEELGDKQGIATTLHQLGMLAQDQGDYTEARRLYGESLKLKEELGDKQGIANTLGQMGQLARAQGQLKDALGYFLRAFAIFDALHSPYRELALRDIASIREKVGEEVFGEWVREMSQ